MSSSFIIFFLLIADTKTDKWLHLFTALFFLAFQEKDCSSVEEVLRVPAEEDEVIFSLFTRRGMVKESSKTNNPARGTE
jgi:hypothetical protein